MHYKLEGKIPVECTVTEWAEWYETNDRRVGKHEVGNCRISTVFLGIEHGFDEHGTPILFETIVFSDLGDDLDDWQFRYTTYEQAETGHAATVEALEEAYGS